MKIDWGKIDCKELAAVVVEKLNEKNIDALLVGGACVSIYTENKYLSYDLDFVSHAPLKEIAAALSEIGFQRESSRHFVRKDCPFFIEFVAPPAAIGGEPVRKTSEVDTELGKIILLTPTDSIKDRLAAYYHWNDPQALEQALMIARGQRVGLREIERWSIQEGHKEKYNAFLSLLRSSKQDQTP